MQTHIRFKAHLILLFFILMVHKAFSAVPVFQHFEDIPSLKNKYIKSIVEDKYGYIWIGTRKGLYQFRNSDIQSLPNHKLTDNIDVQDLFIDTQNQLWIGTKNKGLLMFNNSQVLKIESDKYPANSISKILNTADNTLWIGSDNGLFTVSKDNKLTRPSFNSTSTAFKNKVTALNSTQSGNLLIGNTGVFHWVDLKKDVVKSIKLNTNEYIHDFHVDHENSVWIATSEKLRKYSIEKNEFLDTPNLMHATRILSLQQFENHLWVASIDGGIYSIDIKNNKVNQHTYEKDHNFSIAENHIRTIYISSKNDLWVGNFSGGLSLLNLDQLNFGFQTNTSDSISCAKNSKVTKISVENDKIWLGTEQGLIKYDPLNSTCNTINTIDIEDKYTVYSITKDVEISWLSTSIGLLIYDENSNSISQAEQSNKFSAAFFSLKSPDNTLIIGTDSGLFEYSLPNNSYKKYKSINERFHNKPLIKYAVNNDKEILLPTSSGLLYLNSDNKLEQYPKTLGRLKDKEIVGIHINEGNELFVGVLNEGIYYFDAKHVFKKHYFDGNVFSPSNDISQIQSTKNSNILWLGSKKGLIQLNTKTDETHLFSGTLKNNYLSLFRSSFSYDNNILFAGDSGYVNFNTNQINTQNRKPSLQISQLSLANIPVITNHKTNSGFLLETPIEETTKLNFSHYDKLIKLEFNNLDFYNRNTIRYAYKLEPAVTEWIELPFRDNKLSFTQLETGHYELLIKTTDRDQMWSDQIKSLEIQISPAPWFSWWAYLIYFLALLILIYLYVMQKTRSQLKLNEYLKTQVKKQTRHIESQKTELENLIERKDEIFSNVSHEFRTPITLIQGPVSELTKQEKNQHKVKMLQMVERNSNRLLRLVNQMLELSKSVEKNSQKKAPIQLGVRLELIAEPYLYQAQKSNIAFTYEKLYDITIQATPDALELTIGNFLSNAFKYTPPKGKIHLGTELIDDKIRVYVKDNGAGFNDDQKAIIFRRFGRLSHHHETEGVGIGLAIVKEIATLNEAEVTVESEPNKGSTFSIVFPIDHFSVVNENEKPLTVTEADYKKSTILIIEDNNDMRLHMENILKRSFNCILESNGHDGIATAIKSVPDIIISDVMMPEMNGFQVCRTLRNEWVTSHIPLVLLTALTDRPNRIKGWQEGIDLFIDKPFDAEELIVQLKNIIKVRNILNKKNQNLIKKDIYSELLEIDKDFVIKLKNVIKSNYKDSSFGLAQIASSMFVSEKQLQRKTKALLNLSPLAVLREFRFEQALSSLRKGYQVSVTSDRCGFSSVSYFSQMFKQRYGMSPKQYQNCNKNS